METYKNSQGDEVKKEKYNHLAIAEMSKDVNYNKIDGIIGNNTQKSGLEGKLKEAQELAKKQRERKQERHKDQRHRRGRNRRRQER